MKIQIFRLSIVCFIFGTFFPVNSLANDSLVIHNLGHASVMFEYKGKVIHIDPRASESDYSKLPDADVICITHGHGDHYDLNAINLIDKTGAIMVLTQAVKDLNTYKGETRVMKNGDSINIDGIAIEAVPAYNIVTGNETLFHPKGVGNGYILTFNNLRVYLAGDTHKIPEMAEMDVDIAFIPMNLPYTMTPEMAADAAKALHPKIVYIYHYGSSDLDALRTLLKDEPMEIRIGPSLFVEPTKADGATGFSPVFKDNFFNVYPNPSMGLITIDQLVLGAELSVFDLKGQLVYKKENLNSGSNSIDLQMLNSGNYIVEINSTTSISKRQLIALTKY